MHFSRYPSPLRRSLSSASCSKREICNNEGPSRLERITCLLRGPSRESQRRRSASNKFCRQHNPCKRWHPRTPHPTTRSTAWQLQGHQHKAKHKEVTCDAPRYNHSRIQIPPGKTEHPNCKSQRQRAIAQHPIPTDSKQLKTFTGHTGYYSLV